MNRNNKYYICLHFLFDCFSIVTWQEKFFETANKIKNQYGIEFSKFDFSYNEKDPETKSFLITQKKLDKYKQIKLTKDIYYIYIYSLLSKDTYHSNAEFCFYIRKNTKRLNPYADIYLHMEESRFNDYSFGDWKSKFLEFYNIAQQFGNVKYGILHPVEIYKMPALLFMGMPTSKLCEEEGERVRIWFENQDKYGELLRDVYFANFLNKQHFFKKESVLEKIKTIVGQENIIDQDNGKIIFLPFDLFNINEKNKNIQSMIGKIREIFKDNNMIMTSTK